MNNTKTKNENKTSFFTKKRILAALIIAAVVFCTWTTVGYFRLRAELEEVKALEVNYVVDYDLHWVEPGDSISYIAELYIGDYPGSFDEYMRLIRKTNNCSNNIRVGDCLKIPVYTKVVTEPTD